MSRVFEMVLDGVGDANFDANFTMTPRVVGGRVR